MKKLSKLVCVMFMFSAFLVSCESDNTLEDIEKDLMNQEEIQNNSNKEVSLNAAIASKKTYDLIKRDGKK